MCKKPKVPENAAGGNTENCPCFQRCTVWKQELDAEIKRLEKLITDIKTRENQNAITDTQKQRSHNKEKPTGDRNKKVQANIHPCICKKRATTRETRDLLAQKNSQSCEEIHFSKTENKYYNNRFNEESKSGMKQKESDGFKNKSKLSARQQPDDSSVPLVSKKNNGKNMSSISFTSFIRNKKDKKAQKTKSDKNIQGLSQNHWKCIECGDGEVTTRYKSFCGTHGSCYHNYISLASKKDSKLIAQLTQEVERQREELEKLKEALYGTKSEFKKSSPPEKVIRKNKTNIERSPSKSKINHTQVKRKKDERNSLSLNNNVNAPSPTKNYSEVIYTSQTGLLQQKDISDEKIANTSNEKLTYSTASQTTTKSSYFGSKPGQKKKKSKRKKWLCW